MNGLTFVKGEGGLARKLAGEDHISGFVFYSGAEELPAGWPAHGKAEVNSVTDLEAKGITKDGDWKVEHYHISEYFRQNAGARAFVMLKNSEPDDYTELIALQNFAEGKIRQIGVMDNVVLVGTTVSALQAIAVAMEAANKPCSIILQPDISSITPSTLPDLRALLSPKVSVVIGQDGAATGFSLFDNGSGKTVGCLGAIMGAISKANVHENIGWIEKFNLASTELDIPALGEGSLVKDLDESLLATLDAKGYIFLLKEVGIAGTYFNDSHCCNAITSDYAYIEDSRVIDKAIRGMRKYMLPTVRGPVYVDATTGFLKSGIITAYEKVAGRAIEEMESAGEISGYKVVINPDQDILQTSELVINLVKVNVGVARNTKVYIKNAVKI